MFIFISFKTVNHSSALRFETKRFIISEESYLSKTLYIVRRQFSLDLTYKKC